MDKKMIFSVKILKRERFSEVGAPISDEKKANIISELEKKYGGKVEIQETVVHIYTPILTRNGEHRHRFKLLKDAFESLFKIIFHRFRDK